MADMQPVHLWCNDCRSCLHTIHVAPGADLTHPAIVGHFVPYGEQHAPRCPAAAAWRRFTAATGISTRSVPLPRFAPCAAN